MWLGPAPKRSFNRNRFHFNFRWYYDHSGGLMTDWGAHMIDIANWGVLIVDRGGWEVVPETETKGGKKTYRAGGQPRRGSTGDMHLEHVRNFLDCVDSRQRPNSDVEIGHNSMIACHLGNIAFRTGRRIQWDVANERVVGDAEAQKLVMRPYRAPWSLPGAPSSLL